MIWKCLCGEVNVGTAKECRKCGAAFNEELIVEKRAKNPPVNKEDPTNQKAVQPDRSNRFSTGRLFLFSTCCMAAGLAIDSVPIIVFYIGYIGFWILVAHVCTCIRGPRTFFTSLSSVFLMLFCFVLFMNTIPEISKGYPFIKPEIKFEDDMLDQKNPPYDSRFTELRRDQQDDEWWFNKSDSVIGLDLSEATNKEKRLAKNIYPNYRKAMDAARSFGCNFLPSSDLISGYTKFFNDRLLTALELYIHNGAGIFPGGKQGFLLKLLEALCLNTDKPGCLQAVAYIAAAFELGGGQPQVSPEINSELSRLKVRFLSKAKNCKPIGIYDQSEELQRIFQRDRLLQSIDQDVRTPDDLLPYVRIAEVLLSNRQLLKAYDAFRVLAERLCNPEANFSIANLIKFQGYFDQPKELYDRLYQSEAWKKVLARGKKPATPGMAFWPYSYSRENRLWARIYHDWELPRTSVMDDLVLAIRDGNVDLKPDKDSGWYDYQIHALETLVLPDRAQEAMKLLLHSKYKKKLKEFFETMLTKHRELHVKFVELIPTLGCHIERLPAFPELTVEPLATLYLRNARLYRFLLENLERFFPGTELSGVLVRDMNAGLQQELQGTVLLFYGLYLTVCNDLGFFPQLASEEVSSFKVTSDGLKPGEMDSTRLLPAKDQALSPEERAAWIAAFNQARSWLQGLKDQKFLAEDVRVIVPVLTNSDSSKIRNWAILGTRLLKIKAYYARPPRVNHKIGHENGNEALEKDFNESRGRYALGISEWQPKDYVIPVEVFAEVTMGPEPLTREQFRTICDRYRTKDEIVAALSGRMVIPFRWIVYPAFLLALPGIVFWWWRRRKSL
ncbi:MAG: hypothetical protein PHQ23_08425 [Candidatus Wallbacteria bacterium]|nr:hypothetical protein [Candidatus Wallbacteria bacterium]